jgi:polyadenylate-binding protein 2
MILNESLFRGRLLQVSSKRTNIPGFKRGRGGRQGRGTRGFRGNRARGKRGFAPY